MMSEPNLCIKQSFGLWSLPPSGLLYALTPIWSLKCNNPNKRATPTEIGQKCWAPGKVGTTCTHDLCAQSGQKKRTERKKPRMQERYIPANVHIVTHHTHCLHRTLRVLCSPQSLSPYGQPERTRRGCLPIWGQSGHVV